MLDYGCISNVECMVVDRARNTVYIADKHSVAAIWESSVNDLYKDLEWSEVRGVVLQKRLTKLVHEWLMQDQWSSWISSPDALPLRESKAGVEETRGMGFPSQDILREIRSRKAAEKRQANSCYLPRPLSLC